MSTQNLRTNQIVSYDYSKDSGESGPWKIISRSETPHSISGPSWAEKHYSYNIKNKASGRMFRNIRRKDLNSKKDRMFLDFL